MTDPLGQIERGVPEAWEQLRRIAAVAIIVALGIAFASGIVTWIALSKLTDVRSAEARNACHVRLIGYAFDAAALTLSAPPAPSKARVATAEDFIRAAHRLTIADAVCAETGNEPRPLPPTPVPK